jgi:hypothetical protein
MQSAAYNYHHQQMSDTGASAEDLLWFYRNGYVLSGPERRCVESILAYRRGRK